jgi:hypothetical protein
VRRLALILSIIATLLSSGGVARMAHMMTSHAKGPCGTTSACGAQTHRHSSTSPIGGDQHDDCAVCDELSSLTPAPPLASPFIEVIEVLALVHEREAAQIPAPAPIRALGARPPPDVA